MPADAYRAFFTDVLPARIDKTAIHITNQSLVAFLERFRYPPEQFLNWTGQQAVTRQQRGARDQLVICGRGGGVLWTGDRGATRCAGRERRGD